MKYALRQDPDVILVGEMRDEETMRMALSAAETGHLVLSTLHTMDATETVNRILGSVSAHLQEQTRYQLAATLNGVISQRLLKRKDGQGRIPAVEVMVTNFRVKEMIVDPTRTADLSRAIEESKHVGMQTFDQSLMDLFQKGFISEEEALLHCSNIQDFQLRLQGVVPGKWDGKPEESMKSRKQKVAEALKSKKDDQDKVELDLVDTKKNS